jgi:hypothetical protein
MENPLQFPLARRTSFRILKVLLAMAWAASQVQAQEALAKREAQTPPTCGAL